jgi:site-specific DNA recombinase
MIAAVYARKSTEQTGVADEQKSVARQIEHARQYAIRKGWTVEDQFVFVDDGISGAEFLHRPGFIRLMSALKPRPPFQVLVMSEESRLGREQIATGYALQQIITAGVRVFLYLEDRERTLNSPIEKAMLSLQTMGDELEREKARQRTYDAMERKARAGHVTGGRVFGYQNVIVNGSNGQRSHVRREVIAHEAAVIRRIFQLCADGLGLKAVAKLLNDEGQLSPRAQRNRSQTWAPSSVRAVLFRPLYRGEIVWNQTRNCDKWGQAKRGDRPETDWIRVPAPELRIVTDDLWTAAHARLSASRAIYLRGTGGAAFGRPALGNPSKYLLTNLAQCGVCGHPLRVCTRSHGNGRAQFYGCAGYHDRGRSVCRNNADVPMAEADGIVLEALLDEVLDSSIIDDAIGEALQFLQADEPPPARLLAMRSELARLADERARLVRAIAAGGELDDLVAALQERDARRGALERDLASCAPPATAVPPADVRRVQRELVSLASSWRKVLVERPQEARPIVSALLAGRVTFTPLEKRRSWELRGRGTIAGLLSRRLSVGMASPPGMATGGLITLLRQFSAA